MSEINIEVGDRVTYKYKEGYEIFTRIIETNGDIKITLEDDKEILKIERPTYTIVEEKKELLTEEEKDYLKKFKDIESIFKIKNNLFIVTEKEIIHITNIENKFEGLKLDITYKLKDLRIGGIEMSVKSKVKRCNKRIAELEKELREMKSTTVPLNQIFTAENNKSIREKQIEEYRENFIKVIINQRKPIEHTCCRFSISRELLNTMKNAELRIEENIENPFVVDFILKV